MTPAVVLTIGGVDSAGGAGLHADLRTLGAHAVHAASVVTVLTAQSTVGIESMQPVGADFVGAQLAAVLSDLDVRAVKTGMLASADVVHTVAAVVDGRGDVVVDPVLVSAAGASILPAPVSAAYRDALFPLALVATPNVAEAELLLGRNLRLVADRHDAARELCALGPATVIIKGGEPTDGDEAIDVVAHRSGVVRELRSPRIDTPNDHGTGCSFASAIAAGVALGRPVDRAIDDAKAYVQAAIAGAATWRIGAGHGPIDQLGFDAR